MAKGKAFSLPDLLDFFSSFTDSNISFTGHGMASIKKHHLKHLLSLFRQRCLRRMLPALTVKTLLTRWIFAEGEAEVKAHIK